MNEIQKELDRAFKLISTIPVKDEAVDVMYAARESLRKAYAMAADKEEKNDGR